MNDTTTPSPADQILALMHFMPRSQWACLMMGLQGEERSHFAPLLKTYAERVATMPATYEQDGKGDEATRRLCTCITSEEAPTGTSRSEIATRTSQDSIRPLAWRARSATRVSWAISALWNSGRSAPSWTCIGRRQRWPRSAKSAR